MRSSFSFDPIMYETHECVISLQGGLQGNNNQPFLSFTPYREGVCAVEYNSSSLSLLQAFSICIAVNEGWNPLKTAEQPNASRVDKAYGEMSSIQNERLKSSFSGPIEAEAPARCLSHPPLSPVGRV